jgi:protein associated with RNAse G/E
MLCIKEKRRKRRKFCKHGGWLTFVNYYRNYNTRERIYDDVYAIIESNQSTRASEKKERDKKRALRIIIREWSSSSIRKEELFNIISHHTRYF